MPVKTTASQNLGVSRASPSWVTLGCSIAPRPDAMRRLISGGGTRRRSLSPRDLRTYTLTLADDASVVVRTIDLAGGD